MARSVSIVLALASLAVFSGEAMAVTPFGPNPPGLNGNSSAATKFLRAEEDAPADAHKTKTAAREKGSEVNHGGAKGATAAASKGGRVYLTRSSASLANEGGESRGREKSDATRTKERTAMAKAGRSARKLPPSEHEGKRDEVEVVASTAGRAPASASQMAAASQPPPREEPVLSNPPSSPRIELSGGARETVAVAPPAMNSASRGSQLPGADVPVELHEPARRTTEPAPLANSIARLPGGGGLALNAAGAELPVVLGTLPGGGARRGSGLIRKEILPWYYALAVLLVFVIGSYCFYGMEKRPWLSYTEDWMDGFLWRWEWKRAEVTNLRGFCPTCRSEVTFRPVSTGKDASASSQPPGTWAFCPCCKEATCLEMSDVPQTVARALTRKKDSGEYRESVAASKRKAGVAPGGAVRIKVIEGRVL